MKKLFLCLVILLFAVMACLSLAPPMQEREQFESSTMIKSPCCVDANCAIFLPCVNSIESIIAISNPYFMSETKSVAMDTRKVIAFWRYGNVNKTPKNITELCTLQTKI